MDQDNVRVLIVDDIASVRQGLATMLQLATKNLKPHIEVVGEAQNGCEAIQLTSSCHPDVILMDLEMPIIDGIIATRCIKWTQPDIGIVVLSIHHDELTRLKAAQVGADAFIEKGVALDELLQAILRFRKTSR